jgi:hypothetical protein
VKTAKRSQTAQNGVFQRWIMREGKRKEGGTESMTNKEAIEQLDALRRENPFLLIDDVSTIDMAISALDRLAAYEDTGLEPEEVEAAKEIAARLALADYPHNFQRERSDIASYMFWITSVMKEAKAWWEKLLEAREAAEKALEGMNNDER